MLDRLMAFLALVVLAGFLGVLVWKVPRADLMIIVGITMALAVWDFLANAGRGSRHR